MKTLRIAKGLVEELSRYLELDDRELPLGLLPELQELTYSVSGNTGNTLTSFRQDVGRSITLTRRSSSPDQSSSVSSVEPSSITPARGEAGTRSDLDTRIRLTRSDQQAVYPTPGLTSFLSAFIFTAAETFSLKISRRRTFLR